MKLGEYSKKLNILFVFNQLPAPPRNGVTIPTYNFLKGLSQRNNVSLLYVKDERFPAFSGQMELNRGLVENLWETNTKTYGKLKGTLMELVGKDILYSAKQYNKKEIQAKIQLKKFDIVWISNGTVLNIKDELAEILGSYPIYVAGANDCISAVFIGAKEYVLMEGVALKERALFFIKWMRSWQVSRIENRIIRSYDLILLQTDEDRKNVSKISSGKLVEKVMVISNGVDSDLFANKIDTSAKDILFIGSLSGVYANVVMWLLNEVWPSVKDNNPETRFIIVGRNAPDALRKKINSNENVEHVEFIDNITCVYIDKAITVAPVFKNFGLINKVIEAMAAGVAVVGDSGSFNGITGFENGTHGFVAESATEMSGKINTLIRNSKKRQEMALAARALVRNQFSWEERIMLIESRLEQMMRKGDMMSDRS